MREGDFLFCIISPFFRLISNRGGVMEFSMADFQKLMDAISDIKESNGGIRENQINLQRSVETFQRDLKDTDIRLRSVETNCNREREWDDYGAVKADLYSRVREVEMEATKISEIAAMFDEIRKNNAELKGDLNTRLDLLTTRVTSLEAAVRSHKEADQIEKKIFDRICEKWWAVILIILTVAITLGGQWTFEYFLK